MLEYFREHHRYGEKADFSIRRISLFFVDPAIEADFKTYYFETNLQLWRACHLISVFFYALVSLWDGIVVAPERFEIRLNVLGVVAAFFLAGLLASFFKKRLYSRYWQPLFAFYVLLTGSGFAWVTIQTAPLYPDSNFVGVFFCLIFCYCFIRLTFVFAIAAGSAIILIYALSVWWFIPPGTPQIQTHIFYLAGMNLLGMMVCYAMELISRHEFVLKQLMGQAENRVTRMNQRLENMVAKRTHDLREKNKALEKSVDREKDLVMKLEADEAILQKSLASLSQAESIAKLGYFERNWKTGQGYWSKGFLSLMGLPENFSEPRMDDFLDRLVPGDRKRYEREMMESLIQGKTLDIELALESGPGRATHVHCIADHYYDDDALPLSTRGVFQDISEHVRDRDQVRQLENQLLQAQKMESLGTLAGGIAHDFNNILSPIVGLAELLAEDLEKQSQGSDSARQILTAALRGSDLVRQILSFSRRTDFEPVSVDVSFVVREVLKLARASIPADIEIRERIVLPLLTIQQYALQKIECQSEHKAPYEKMVLRSLYGNINASRNSA